MVSHGFVEAPGYRPNLLTREQALFLQRASAHILGGTFLLEDVVLPSPQPDASTLAPLIEGAVQAMGFAVPASTTLHAVGVTTTARTSSTRREWVVRFERDGAPVLGSMCFLVANADTGDSASLLCSVTAPPRMFETYAIDSVTARDYAARYNAGDPNAVNVVKRHYDPQDGIGRARFEVTASYGIGRELVTVLDGAGRVLSVISGMSDYFFSGYRPDYRQGRVTTSFTTGLDQTGLDSSDFKPGFDPCEHLTLAAAQTCGHGGAPGGYRHGFVVCRNDASPALLTVPPSNPNQFINIHDAPGFPTLSLPEADSIPLTPLLRPSDFLASGVHFPEVQAYASIQNRERVYTSLGHKPFSNTVWQAPADPGVLIDATDPCRATIFVNVFDYQTLGAPPAFDANASTDSIESPYNPSRYSPNAGASLHQFVFGVVRPLNISPQFIWPYGSDGGVAFHEYHHHITRELEVFGGLASHRCPDDFPSCAAGAVEEGVADSMALFGVGGSRFGVIAWPSVQDDPCQQPDHSTGSCDPLYPVFCANRAGCNAVAVEPASGAAFSLPPYGGTVQDPHTRGQVTLGALYGYARRLREGGLPELTYMQDTYEAHRLYLSLANPLPGSPTNKDERALLQAMIFWLTMGSDPNAAGGTNFLPFRLRRQGAQVAFAEKGVLPFDPGANPGSPPKGILDSCGSQILADCMRQVRLSLAITAPLQLAAQGAPPTFSIYTPTNIFITKVNSQAEVKIDLSPTPDFAGGLTVSSHRPGTGAPNNSPKGFYQWQLTADQWATFIALASASSINGSANRLYYRARVCLAADPSTCVATSEDSGDTAVPYADIAPGTTPPPPNACNCRVPGAEPRNGSLAWLSSSLLAMGLLLRRRRARS